MGVITRFFECTEENCKAKIKRWANDNHQEETQNCPNKKCKRPTKACRSIYEGRLFGKFICDAKRGKKTCGKEWFSGNAYYNKWQECQRCHHRCTPVYLREHDKKEKYEDDETKPHPDQLCQKCKEWKTKTGNQRARCIDYESRERRDEEIDRIKATYVEGANMTKMKSLTQTQLGWSVTKDEQKKVQEEILKKKVSEKAKMNQAKNDKKTAVEMKAKTITNEKNNTAKLQKSLSLDNCYWDSDNEEDRENWFYTADEVYLDAPFRLQDYKEKLESGSVKEAPSCEPYRKLYFLHLDKLAAENQSKDKKKKARLMFNNLYSLKIQEVANKKKKHVKKEAVSKTAVKTAPKDKTEDNKEKTTSSAQEENQKCNKKQEVSKNEDNWFYTADEVYFDAPFRLQDYKEKLESGSVRSAPMFDPYRQLYLLHSALLEAKSQPKLARSGQKTNDANHSYLKFYSLTIQEARKMKTALENNVDVNKENITSTNTSKSPQNESSLENKMASLTVSSSQKATRTSTSSRRVLTKLG